MKRNGCCPRWGSMGEGEGRSFRRGRFFGCLKLRERSEERELFAIFNLRFAIDKPSTSPRPAFPIANRQSQIANNPRGHVDLGLGGKGRSSPARRRATTWAV